MPGPCGRVPCTAAATISGARKARFSVCRTERSLQPSRAAIWCVSSTRPAKSSSSQARAFAIPHKPGARLRPDRAHSGLSDPDDLSAAGARGRRPGDQDSRGDISSPGRFGHDLDRTKAHHDPLYAASHLLGLAYIGSFDLTRGCALSALELPQHNSFDLGCRHPRHRAGRRLPALSQSARDIVAIARPALLGRAWGHTVAAVIEDAPGQKRSPVHPKAAAFRLSRAFLLYSVEEFRRDDRLVLARIVLILVDHLADIHPVASTRAAPW
jgi:hypothetical protein